MTMSIRFRFLVSLASICILALLPAAAQDAPATAAENSGKVSITTRSAEARNLYVRALVKMQNLHGQEAMQDLRKAVQLDPDFALANIIMAFPVIDPIIDPADQVFARDKAKPQKRK